MRNGNGLKPNEVKKLHLEEVVLFAINNIPQADSTTLKQFLELVSAGGTFGTISHEQIVRKMEQILRYVPGACVPSLLILLDLLEIEPAAQLALKPPRDGRLRAGASKIGTTAFFVETSKAAQ